MAIILNDNIDTRSGKPTDSRYGTTLLGATGFYTSVSGANAAIPTYQRYIGLTVGIKLGASAIVEYWYANGITDGDLVLKTSSGNLTGITPGNGITVSGTLPSLTVAIDPAVVQTVSNLSTNVITDGASDTKYPSVKSVKTYVDGLTVGLLDDRGSFAPSTSTGGPYPSSGGSGTPPGTIVKGDLWYIRSDGYLGSTFVSVGASVRALVDSPSPTTATDWDILDAGLGYIPENEANKVTSGTSITSDPTNPTKYPSVKALTEYLSTVTPSLPTLQEVVSSEAGANVVTGYTIDVQNTLAGDLTTSIGYGEVILQDVPNGGTILVGSSNKIQVQLGTDFTTYEFDRITFNKSGFQTSLLAKDSNQTVFLPSPIGTQVLAVSVNGNYADDSGEISLTGFTGGSGTPNYLSKWATSTTLTDSQLFDNGTNVGVGTITPNASARLDVNGYCHIGTGSPSTYLGNDHTMEITATGTAAPLTVIGGTAIVEIWSNATRSAGAVSYGAAFPGLTSDGNAHFATFMNSNNSWNDRIIIEKDEGRVSIGKGSVTADSSALLEISSTTKGFLPPRLSDLQRDAIVSPATGLVIYNTTTNSYNFRGASSWKTLISGTGTTNTIPKFTSSGLEVGDSIIKEIGGTQVQIGSGGGVMAFPYETLVLEKPGDIKFGVYTSGTNPTTGGTGGASYVLGATNFVVPSTGLYPGFEYQFVGNTTDANNKVRYNYIRRNASGVVASEVPDLLTILADGKIGMSVANPAYTLDLSGSANFLLSGNTLSSPFGNKFSIRNGMVRLGINVTDGINSARFLQFTNEADNNEYFLIGATPGSSSNLASEQNPVLSMCNKDAMYIYSGPATTTGTIVLGSFTAFTFKKDGRVRYTPLPAEPITNLEVGDTYYDATLNKLRVYTPTGWENLH